MEDINNAARFLADWCKRQHDAALNWEPQEYALLALEYNGHRTTRLPAEIHREPPFGFSRTERVTVRVKIDLDTCPPFDLSDTRLSLYRDGELFGEPNGWRLNEDRPGFCSAGTVDCFFDGNVTQ